MFVWHSNISCTFILRHLAKRYMRHTTFFTKNFFFCNFLFLFYLFWKFWCFLAYAYSVIFRAFLLPENGSKNSILNWVLKLNLDQQTFWNTTNTIYSRNFQYLDLLVIQIKVFLVNQNKCEPRSLLPT